MSQRDNKENLQFNLPTNDIMEKRDQESTKYILKEIRSQIDSMISNQQPIDAGRLPNFDLGTLNPNNSVVIDLQPLPLDTLNARAKEQTPLTNSHVSAFNLAHPDKQALQQMSNRVKMITK